jgi:hypothetical protein
MNFQSWTMDKYITWKQFSSFARALRAGGAVCTGAHWDKVGDPHRGFSVGVATKRGEEVASASATTPRWRRRHRSGRSWGATSRRWRRNDCDAQRMHRGEVSDHGGDEVTRLRRRWQPERDGSSSHGGLEQLGWQQQPSVQWQQRRAVAQQAARQGNTRQQH